MSRDFDDSHAGTPGHPECFGTVFPDMLHLPEDRPASGKVFTVLLRRAGGLYRSDRSVTADMAGWEECKRCPEFDGCYKFSMAKLAVESAVLGL